MANEVTKDTKGQQPKGESLKNSVVLPGADSYPQGSVFEFLKSRSPNIPPADRKKAAS